MFNKKKTKNYNNNSKRGSEEMEEKIKELNKISEPVINFIKENYNPHTTIIISEDSIKVVTDEINIPLINQFWLQDRRA